MATETLLLGFLLVVAAASGWLVARLTSRKPKTTRSAVPPAEFYRGLNHVLSDESDQALALLQSMAQADSGLVEIHFALGTLFRQRGETDRAIRIHQNLMARPDLAKRHREQALYALAEDYLKAGLFDRAEALFGQLVDQGVRKADSLQRLVSIYEKQQDWTQAIAARRKLASLAPGNHDQITAHYYCEIAQAARDNNELGEMRRALKKANKTSSGIMRGALMRADLAVLSDDMPLALKLYREILETTPGFAWLILQRLDGCFEPDALELSRELQAALKRQPALEEHLAKAALATGLVQNPVVTRATSEYIAGDPALSVLSDTYEDNHAALSEVLHSFGLAMPVIRCRECGYNASVLFWQCPGCQLWESGQSDIRLTAQ